MRGESSAEVALRVAAAYERQRARYADWPWSQNAHVAAGAVPRLLPLERATPTTRGGRSSPSAASPVAAPARIRRVARTLADLDDSPDIGADHLDRASLLRGDVP